MLSYRGYRFPPDIISHAVWLYHRFALSFRDVEDVLARRGVDARPGLASDVRQWSGDSRGHWEGDTLVIETRNFADKRRWRGTTESMRLVERLTRVDFETLVYEFTVTDPETWTSPWTASVPMVLNPEPIYEYACHEGNYSMPLMLGGARAEEMVAQEAAKTGSP